MAGERLWIEVVYAGPEEQEVIALEVAEGTTVREAVELSGLAARHGGADLTNARIGIFGCEVTPDTPVREGERVEIYRPLEADPKQARRRRAARAR